MRERATDDRHPGHLEIEHMAPLFDDDFLPRLCMKPYSDLVAHAARRDEQSGLRAHDLGGPFLEANSRRVFAVNIIAHLGASHCFSHLIGGLRYGVASQIDVVHFQSLPLLTSLL